MRSLGLWKARNWMPPYKSPKVQRVLTLCRTWCVQPLYDLRFVSSMVLLTISVAGYMKRWHGMILVTWYMTWCVNAKCPMVIIPVWRVYWKSVSVWWQEKPWSLIMPLWCSITVCLIWMLAVHILSTAVGYRLHAFPMTTSRKSMSFFGECSWMKFCRTKTCKKFCRSFLEVFLLTGVWRKWKLCLFFVAPAPMAKV